LILATGGAAGGGATVERASGVFRAVAAGGAPSPFAPGLPAAGPFTPGLLAPGLLAADAARRARRCADRRPIATVSAEPANPAITA
jgi:hypothetical protein